MLATALMADPAAATRAEGGMWLTGNLMHRLAADLVAGLVIEPRFDRDVGRLERLLLRPSVTRTIDRTALTFGYDAHLIKAPRDRLEQRLWQQVQFNGRDDRWRPAFRLRMEERFIEDLGGVTVTARLKAQVMPRIPGTQWYLRAANEVFLNFNEQGAGPLSGYDQNRAQLALGRQLGGAGIELGYQAQHLRLRGGDRLVHQLLAAVSLRF